MNPINRKWKVGIRQFYLFLFVEKKHFIGKLHCFTDRGLMFTRLGSEFMPLDGSLTYLDTNSEVKRIFAGSGQDNKINS
jgi:hypothetical protein